MADTIDWSPVQRSRTYQLVLEKVEQQIIAGRLRVGDRLPAERDFAAQLGVSRASLREALRVLEAQGAVRLGVGTGQDSGTIITALPRKALTRFLRLHVALASFDMDELVDARIGLERSSVRLAAQQATAEDVARMTELLEGMEAKEVSREAFNDLDTEFHVSLAAAAHNRLLSEMTIAIRASVRPALLEAMERHQHWEELKHTLCGDHRAILDAVAAGRADDAERLVSEHIRGAYLALFSPGPGRS
ncbi:FadR/GntR family transcriptional regulator [Haloechinothrix sp. LS1_15]|uniref:FadR/GntR family transcriptional regulator n=1 Tax=Haloechinothrix sp. LS1_15 TaxID=2652248 RepID=UPI0029488174|nr:FadR/GntR family transcriptional regulator [Haloechinothrix sp. LS1_15]MDV6013667.1 FadR family transcriptional regulator [Haloechinothrix sp. LS1_15]